MSDAGGLPTAPTMAEPSAAQTSVEPGANSSPGLGARLREGQRLDRYVLLGQLGAGGMGVVHAAYDPELDRRVAIKVLHPSMGIDNTDGRSRLLREAQAMAQLTHPNVITVHDVGTVDGRVYLAMEYVEGRTLTDWLDDEKPGWDRIVEKFLAAGRGLAAAHAQGLIHRDFKPDNVMVGNDGRVRVMDFGLARASGQEDEPGHPVEAPSPRPSDTPSSHLHTPLTQLGQMVGTPAFMAPEQFLGLDVGPAADQFSYCVALWRSLYGKGPFDGRNVQELSVAVTEGKRRPVPRKGPRVPSWVRKILDRGMSSEPVGRWPDMAALLAALERNPRPRQAIAVAVAAIATWVYVDHRLEVSARNDAEASCAEAALAASQVWNDDARGAMHQAMQATDVPYAEDTFARTTPWLDGWVKAWSESFDRNCRDHTVERPQPGPMYEASLACFEQRRLEFAETVEAMNQIDARGLSRAVSRAANVRGVGDCLDEHWLERRPAMPEDAEVRARILDVRETLAKAHAQVDSGRYKEALPLAESALESAEDIGWKPLVGSAHRGVASVQLRMHDFDPAREHLGTAYYTAERVGDTELSAGAATEMAFMLGVDLREAELGAHWAELADIAIEAEERPLTRAKWRHTRGAMALTVGDAKGAEVHLRESIRLRADALGDAHPQILPSRANLAIAIGHQGRLEEAIEAQRTVIDKKVEAFGPTHPSVASTYNNLATLLEQNEQLEEALTAHETALKIRRAALRENHPRIGDTLYNLGVVKAAMNDLEGSAASYREAITVWEAGGAKPMFIGFGQQNLATVLREQGDLEGAMVAVERAIEIMESIEDESSLAMSLTTLGQLKGATGHPDEAKTSLERAWTLWEKQEKPDPGERATTALALAETIENADPERARTLAAEAGPALEKAKKDEAHARADALLGRLASAPPK